MYQTHYLLGRLLNTELAVYLSVELSGRKQLQSHLLVNSKNLHLIVSAIIITIVSLVYGLYPNNILPGFFDFSVESIDLKQIFRATMGLYLGMVVLWLIGISKLAYWRIATISNVLFMGGLALGRIMSLVVDGIPSIAFSVGLGLELTLGLWGIINLNKYRTNIKA